MYAIIQHRTFVWRDKMFIKDRGSIKWTSLMLVEHRKVLEKLKDSEELKEKPELTEQELKRLNRIVKEALKLNKLVNIVYYKQGKFEEIKGLIKKYLPLKRQILLLDNCNKVYLDIDNIFKIRIN